MTVGAFLHQFKSNRLPAPVLGQVFAQGLYSGSGSFSVSPGINLTSNGGAVWYKRDSGSSSHRFAFTSGQVVYPDDPDPANTTGESVSYGTAGFSVNGGSAANGNGFYSIFRNARRFVDVQTFVLGSGNNVINHNLGVTPGVVFLKCTTTTDSWYCFFPVVSLSECVKLDINESATNRSLVSVSNSQITVSSTTSVTAIGHTYVAYIFANDTEGDGIIRSGQYVGQDFAQQISIGWNPQWIIIKNRSSSDGWFLRNSMMPADSYMSPDGYGGYNMIYGFSMNASGVSVPVSTIVNSSGNLYNWLAVRA
ncbi:hypothetical protein [Niveispirillum sp. KHB5.9]|uniref:DUF7483 domain-containing protein n=1 Tax=Niveispirillum sp. KHB5.9 TaxID=3400269 RepID=UPI003A861256